MAKRKALVLYGSITGNTALVAGEFQKVCEENGFDTDLVKIDPRRDWDKDPLFVEDYDLVCLGSPIIAGLPYKEVSMLMGLQGKKQLYRNREVYQRIQDFLAAGGHLGPGAGEVLQPGQIPGVHYDTGIPGIVCMDVGTGAPGSQERHKEKDHLRCGVLYLRRIRRGPRGVLWHAGSAGGISPGQWHPGGGQVRLPRPGAAPLCGGPAGHGAENEH